MRNGSRAQRAPRRGLRVCGPCRQLTRPPSRKKARPPFSRELDETGRAFSITASDGGDIVTRGMQRRVCVTVACAVVFGLSVSAHDWPQFLGPQRNGVYAGPPLAAKWPAGGPRRVWQTPVGAGFAGPAVVGDRVVVFHRVGAEEVVDALDLRTGAPRWHVAYATSYRDDFGFDEGPRAVPVVSQGR